MPDRDLLKDLMERKPALYWADFLGSALGGWALFGLAYRSGSAAMAVGAAILLYRALFFVHELSHMPHGTLPGFRLAWDALVGIPFLIPASLYLGTHRDHHRESTYATGQDPEYSYLIRDGRIAMALFMLQPLLVPVAISLRFLVLAPLGILVPRFHRFLEERLSTLSINPAHRRAPLTAPERRELYLSEIAILAVWLPLLASGPGFLLTWYAVVTIMLVLNQSRTLLAHRYLGTGVRLSREEQAHDSVTIQGGPLMELWMPLGSRFHALHHLFPALPYHSMPEAHRRLLAAGGLYGAGPRFDPWAALADLWRNAGKPVKPRLVISIYKV